MYWNKAGAASGVSAGKDGKNGRSSAVLAVAGTNSEAAAKRAHPPMQVQRQRALRRIPLEAAPAGRP
jgi:hypothetical protein